MATYKKQLKDSNGDLIYPVQGLGTITSDNIDWSTITPRIIQAGQISVGSVGANTEKRGIVAIPTQDDTNYVVIYSHAADVSGYDHCVPTTRTANKTTSQFQWNVYNSGSASGNLVLGYVVVKY